MSLQLRDWSPGDALTASHLQEVVGAVRSLWSQQSIEIDGLRSPFALGDAENEDTTATTITTSSEFTLNYPDSEKSFGLDAKLPPAGRAMVYRENDGTWRVWDFGSGYDSTTTLGEGSEGTTTADTTTWVAGGDDAMDLWVVSNVVFDHSGDSILYAMLRKLTVAPSGKILSAGAETRVTVDAPTSCASNPNPNPLF